MVACMVKDLDEAFLQLLPNYSSSSLQDKTHLYLPSFFCDIATLGPTSAATLANPVRYQTTFARKSRQPTLCNIPSKKPPLNRRKQEANHYLTRHKTNQRLSNASKNPTNQLLHAISVNLNTFHSTRFARNLRQLATIQPK